MHRTSTRLSAAALIAFSLANGAAFAQGSITQKNACRPDVFRLCGSFIPNVGEIVACLRGNEPRLSGACHQVMFGGRAESARYATTTRIRSDWNQ
jgi:hypothetical protein